MAGYCKRTGVGWGGVGWVRLGEGCSNDYHGIGRGGETGGCGLWSQGGVWVGGGWLGLQVKVRIH